MQDVQSNPMVLIVDDEPEILDILKVTLADLPAQLCAATNGRKAYDLIQTRPANVIVSDLDMPELGGLDLLAQLRAEGYQMPFIILTGFGSKEASIEALRLGAFDFLEKPFDGNELKQLTLEALKFSHDLANFERELDLPRENNLGPNVIASYVRLWANKKNS